MKISISVTSYNRKELTKYCINSIIKTTPKKNYELIVVDNNSTDGAVEMLKNMEGIDKLILNPKNYHLGKAINQAFREASDDCNWVFTLSNDYFLMDGWFENFRLVNKDLKPDYIFCLLMKKLTAHKLLPRKDVQTKSNGWYRPPVVNTMRGSGVGAGLAIKKSVVKKYNIKLREMAFTKGFVGPFPILCKWLNKNNEIKGIHLGKPCALFQNEGFTNSKYKEYYKETFGERGTLDRLEFYKVHGKHTNLKDYYKGTSYLKEVKSGKAYPDLNSIATR